MSGKISVAFYLLVFFVVFGCSNKKDTKEQNVSQASSIADSLMKITDSLRARDYLHKNFYGIHKHGQDLAKHAHQNIPKKIRMRKKQRKLRVRE